MIKFSIPIYPIAKGRPRFYSRGKFVGTYTPTKTRTYESQLIGLSMPYKPDKPIVGPVKVEVLFGMPIPKAFSKKKRLEAIDGELTPTTKPDLDNLIKCLDFLNGIFIEDDRQIVSLSADKRYVENPYIEINILRA